MFKTLNEINMNSHSLFVSENLSRFKNEDPRDFRMKVDLPSFNGHSYIEEFLD